MAKKAKTKAQKAREIVEKNWNARPKDVIAKIQTRCDLPNKGAASTYFYNAYKYLSGE